MADLKANAAKQNRKRKQTVDAQPQKSSKLHRSSPWNNLQLISCIQDKHHDLLSKVNQAFNFVQSKVGDGVGSDQDCQTIKLPRLICYLNDWILTLLFPPNGKENWGNGKTLQLEGIEAYMDIRCWEIFKFCLQESLKFRVSLKMSRNLLQTVQFIARNALSLLEDSSISSGELCISDERYKLYDITLDCVLLVFSSHGGLSNENLDLWVETAKVALELVLKMYSNNLDGSNVGAFALRFLWSVLQPFSKFLGGNSARKGFHNFVDKLLEPLLHLSGELHLRGSGSNPIWMSRLIKVVEEVLSHGLFHSGHLKDFLSLHGSETIKSYPRHLFDELNKIIARKNAMAMGSLGLLFRLYVNSARKFKDASQENAQNGENEGRKPGENSISNNISADTQKPFFNFFELIMEPLLLKINAYIQVEIDTKPLLLDLHGLLKSIGNLLASFMQEKVYVRAEDTSGGACLNFLKKIFNTLITSSASIFHLSNYDTINKMEIFSLSANEILVAVGYLLEIEYEVIGEDLVNLWLLMLSCSAINCNLVNALDQCSLSSTTSALGCQLINLYCQLRQVEIAILALCKAIRLIVSHEGNTEESSSRFLTFLSNEVHSEAVESLLSSQKFIHAIYKAVESIPEGQVRGCIRQIIDDISESLRWMKDFCSLVDGKKLQIFNLQVELLGRGLSRLYCLVLDSVTITDSNSSLLGVAVKELMALMRPYLSILVGQQPDTIYKFFSSVMGETVDQVVRKGKVLKKFGRSSQWVIVFFFQLFVSCRSLYRRAIRFMPPGFSKKMSAEVVDFRAYSGSELMKRIDEIDIGFFSWIVQPSASLLVVMQFISDIYLKLSPDDSSPLIYIFQSMALQRLDDLNSLIISFKYKHLLKKHYKSQINTLKEEAAGLTNFVMENLSCVYQSPIFVSDYVTCEDVIFEALQSNQRDPGVYVADKKSLPTVIWSKLCRNVDIWSNHASKKQLKKFFSHVLHASHHCVTSSFQEPGVQEIDECKLLKRVTLSQISSELLIDSLFYQQKFAHRNLASMFCHALEKSVLPLFSNIPCTDVNLRSLPNWLEFVSVLDNSAVLVDENKEILVNCSAVESSTTHSGDKLPADISRKEKTYPLTNKNFRDCHHLLDLLHRMPVINARSFSHFVTCIFNLERLLVSALLYFQSTVCQDYFCEYLRLFDSCRKALRFILMGFYDKAGTIQSSPTSIISGSSFPVLWLSKSLSVVVGIKEAFSAKNIKICKSLMFSLMDHTSHVLFGIGKYQIVHVLSTGKEAEMPCEDISNHKSSHAENHLLPSSQDSPKLEALKSLTFMAENLKERMQSLLVSVHNNPCCVNAGFSLTSENINRLSSAVSCFSGVLWALTSFTGQTDAKDSDKKEVLMWKSEHASELNSCIFSLVELTDFFVNKLLIESNQLFKSSYNTQRFEKSALNLSLLGTNYLSPECLVSKANASAVTQKESKTAATCFTSSAIDNVSKSASDLERILNPESENSVASVLARVDSTEPQGLNKPLLQSLVKGDHPEIAFLLRQLLIASSFLLRLNLQKDACLLPSIFVPTFIEISQVLLLEFSEMVAVPQQSAFLLLDGALSYLRELAGYFPFTDPISGKVYTKLIQIHMRAIGNTILLQGKRPTLTFHERQSSTKTLHTGSIEAYPSTELHCIFLDEFKTRLRMSFKAYIERPSESHLSSTIQAIQDGCTMIYDVNTSKDEGEILLLVAAGIDCFDMILKFVSGRKGLKMIKSHCQSLIAAVLNIIVHLRRPLVFYDNLASGTVASTPYPGSAILMCVEVLVTVSRKRALFPMDVGHVGNLLHIPAVLFENFHQLRVTKASGPSEASMISEEHICDPVERVNFYHVDHQFSVNVFVACCQLLCTIIRHRPSECKQCVANLEASVDVLLNCLEGVLNNESIMNKGCFSSEEGVKCACFLRRIYEEIKQQKDIFSRQCSLFLSNYIWVYSGYGPKRSGIRREVDEALRPGVYALIDACSVDDLQYLHTVFGGICKFYLVLVSASVNKREIVPLL
ncbi:Nucleolar 27S pre-rRNA processing, Urb2/Npa2, C-terminal [Spatholobus suberectus]|nr:Nucleolar 27S pre-rRNA processing, Urb2/Npa2, C-terminal [Spatholobus suberectus]